jgi:hypothetical protein
VTASTSPIPFASRRGPSPIGALLLAVAGNILVLGILATAAVAAAAAAVVVFGPAVFSAL